MRFTSLVIELIRARPRLVVWIVVLLHAGLWLTVPLLNGLDHVVVLRRRFGSGRVAAGTMSLLLRARTFLMVKRG